MEPKAKGFSLKWGLLGIVIGCWLVPVALTLGSLAYYTTQSVRRQFDETVRASISHAAFICRRTMSEIVTASRHASYEGTVRTAYQRYAQTGNSQILYEAVNSFLSQNYRYNDNFLTTMLFFSDDPSNIYYTFNPSLNSSYSTVLEYQRSAHSDVISLSRTLDTKIAFLNSNGNIYVVRNIVDTSFKPYATIVMLLDSKSIFGSFSNIVWETGATVYLNGVPVNAGTGDPDMPPIPIPDYPRLSAGEQIVAYSSDAIRVYGRESIDAVEILYAVEVDIQSFLRGFFNFTDIVYYLLFMSIPLLALAVLFFYRNIFRPIKRLSHAAGTIQDGNLGYTLESRVGNREFKYLNDAFNVMSVRLKQQFEWIYSEELALRDARIMALQSQINPHFLNNTLEIINWEIRLGNNAKASKMIESLATMLDAAMDRKSSPLVTLAQEMMYVDAYLYIISERFGKRLSVVNEMDCSLLQYKVPKLIMQPIIENAIEHGIGSKQKGEIFLIAVRSGSVMKLGVKNSGTMSKEDVEIVARLLSPDYDAKLESSPHLGIHNVNLRLRMIYGESYGLKIESDDNGTVSWFEIPIDSDGTVLRQ